MIILSFQSRLRVFGVRGQSVPHGGGVCVYTCIWVCLHWESSTWMPCSRCVISLSRLLLSAVGPEKLPGWLEATDYGWHGPPPPWRAAPLPGRYPLAETPGDGRVAELGFLRRSCVNSALFVMALITERSVNRADSAGQMKGSIWRWLVTLTLKELSSEGWQRGYISGVRGPTGMSFIPPLWRSALLACWEEADGHDKSREPETLLFCPALPTGPSRKSLSLPQLWWHSPWGAALRRAKGFGPCPSKEQQSHPPTPRLDPAPNTTPALIWYPVSMVLCPKMES